MYRISSFKHEYEKSYFKYIEPVSDDYRVFVNGEEASVYTCRISAYPFNRVWPGHQREINQTVIASYVNIVSDEEIKIEVLPNFDFGKMLLKPLSKNTVYEEKNGMLSFCLTEQGQFVLQSEDGRHCLYIFNSKPIEEPAKEDVTYYFGPGIHFPGKIRLYSNESVYVSENALVFGCIYAEKADNIHIFGNGIIDDSHEERTGNYCYEEFTNGNMKFYDCTNLRIEGIGMKNSAIWCLNFFGCSNACADGIKIFGQWRYNTDGIDIVNSRDITIKNSFIHSFDDCITVKGIDRYCNLNNINILTDRCVLWCDWGKCCEVGIETACREYKNICFQNCDILRGGFAALDISNGDVAEISNIRFENINIEFNGFDTAPQFQETDDAVYQYENTAYIPYFLQIRNSRFRNPGSKALWGLDDMAKFDLSGIRRCSVHDVTVKNINIFYSDKLSEKDKKPIIQMYIKSTAEEATFDNINISDIKVNGKKIPESDIIMKDADI